MAASGDVSEALGSRGTHKLYQRRVNGQVQCIHCRRMAAESEIASFACVQTVKLCASARVLLAVLEQGPKDTYELINAADVSLNTMLRQVARLELLGLVTHARRGKRNVYTAVRAS